MKNVKEKEQKNKNVNLEVIREMLVWSIRPKTSDYYPVLGCALSGEQIYNTGLVKRKNGKVERLHEPINDFIVDFGFDKLMEYGDILRCIYNKADIFEQVVKDFEMPDEDKPYLWKFLTDFSIDQFFKGEISYDFIMFLLKYNFRVALLQ